VYAARMTAESLGTFPVHWDVEVAGSETSPGVATPGQERGSGALASRLALRVSKLRLQ